VKDSEKFWARLQLLIKRLALRVDRRVGYLYMLITNRLNQNLENYVADFANPERRHSKSLVILGSGESLNSLTQDEIECYQNMDSIGINFTGFNHAVRPKECLIEVPPHSSKAREVLLQLMSSADGDQKFYVNLFHARMHPEHSKPLLELPNVFCFDIVRFKTLKKLRFKINAYLYLNLTHRYFFRPIHHGASLVMTLTIGMMRGYEEIHLVGIDLNGSKYFYDSPEYKNSPLADLVEIVNQVESKISKKMHLTQDRATAALFSELAVVDTCPYLVTLLRKKKVNIVVRGEDSGFRAFLK